MQAHEDSHSLERSLGSLATGYGEQTRQLARHLQSDEHEVAVSCFYGLSGTTLSWEGLTLYPSGFDAYGNDILVPHAANFMDGDPRAGIVITLVDAWVLNPDVLRQTNTACWVPVDHEPCPPRVLEVLAASGCWPIAMSRFGERMLRAAGLECFYVPHGVDTQLFRPLDRDEIRADMDLDGRFVVGMVAANKGYPSRKCWSQAVEAFAEFARAHDDAVLYLHTEPNGTIGHPISQQLAAAGIPPDRVRVTDPYVQIVGGPPDQVARLHNAFDVLLNPSMGEGFGIPVVEAQACFPAGTPIEAEKPLATWCRSYTGDLVTITTARGSFEATSNHPVWTDRGWQKAGSVRPGNRILYCHAPEGMEQVHAGPVDAIVDALRADASQRSGSGLWHDEGRGVVPVAEPRAHAKAILGAGRTEAVHVNGTAALLPGRARGRRGHCDDQEAAARRASTSVMEAVRDRLEHGRASDGLADRGDQHAFGLRRLAADAVGLDFLSVLGRRPVVPATLRGARASAGLEGRPHATRHRVDTPAALAIQDRPLDGKAARDHLSDPRSQYEAVTSVNRRHVEGEPVYNLTTASGTYRVGPGYLVHNCGTPVIVTDCTAMSELCGAGWKLQGDRQFTDQRAYMTIPRAVSIVAALEDAHARAHTLRDAARGFAVQYDADLVYAEHWRPVLAELERRIAPLPLPDPSEPVELEAVAA